MIPLYIVATAPQTQKLTGEKEDVLIPNQINHAKIRGVLVHGFEEGSKIGNEPYDKVEGKETRKEKLLFILAS